MSAVISKPLCKYFNIDIKSSNSDKVKLKNFCDLFDLKNLVPSLKVLTL